MLALSTSWNSSKHSDGEALISEIRSAGFDSVELNFSLTGAVVEAIQALKEKGLVRVLSLHNMCPLPDEIAPDKASPDYYSLSSSDPSERALAIKAAKNTVFCAARLGAKAVVLHAGRCDVKDGTRKLSTLIGEKGKFESFRDEMMRARRERSGADLDNVIKSLKELVPVAHDSGVAIGVENRYYYSEIPILEEFDALFSCFGPDKLRYWHDVGHAEVFDRLGLGEHRLLLERLSGRLLGVHLHDIIGPVTDHRPPGEGTFDFARIRPYLNRDTLTVMEIHSPATADQIRHGAEHLKKALGLEQI